ncbi:PTER protein, partial [Polyodon spathula]|nr:PTER protein [Polyodon spathula]
MSAQSVLGLVDPNQLGRTLTHEHLTVAVEFCFHSPPPGLESLADTQIEMQNLFWLKQNPYSSMENLLLMAEKEELQFKRAGGGTIMENTNTGIHRDVKTLKWLSQETGVHVIAGAGYYVFDTHSSETRSMSIEKATAHAQSQLGCLVIIHPGRNIEAPFQVIRILQEAGSDISKTVMSHLDRTLFESEKLLEFAKLGSYLECDLFGTEMLNYHFNPDVDMPSDNERINR